MTTTKFFLGAALATLSFSLQAQHSGNKAYEPPYSQYGYQPDLRRNAGAYIVCLPNDSVYQLQASVLINLEPDAYLVVYSIHQEALTVAECSKLINSRIQKFKDGLSKMGIPASDVFVDMIAQTRIYDFAVDGNTAKQYQQGFEYKKNIIIKFKRNDMLENINVLAAGQDIFDIVKVDYIVSDIEKVQNRLRTEAIKVLENKRRFMSDNSTLNITDKGIIQSENFNTVYPNESYHKYVAAESAVVQPQYYNSQAWVHEQRKSSTFYFERQHTSPYDKIINPEMVSVPVQMSINMSVKYYIPKPVRKK